MTWYILLAAAAVFGLVSAQSSFRFANYYGDNMVLQRAPATPAVWGYNPSCGAVTVHFNGQSISASITHGSTCKFLAKLPATSASGGGPYTITAETNGAASISLSNVLFGDVWVCGGQSNMVFELSHAYNGAEEITKAAKYRSIRIFTIQRVASETPLEEPPEISQQWSEASSKTGNVSVLETFSAVCYLYGRNIYDQYKVPIGLVSSNWGGTPDEAWSSPEALKQCTSTDDGPVQKKVTSSAGPNPHEPSVLWNAMMYPLLNMTIYGAIWYQGEANSGNPGKYNCSFPAMINDWREKWNDATDGDTKAQFPFGFVQLSAVGTNNQSEDGFAGIRWSQTAGYGYVPNPAMENVFMAVAMDLGDPTSPYGSVHPRDKETVGERLALAGRAIAYQETSLYYTGPLVTSYNKNVFTFRNIPAEMSLELRSPFGFEIGCTSGSTAAQWLPGTAKEVQSRDSLLVDFPECPQGLPAKFVRYSWMEDPCPYLKCAVYAGFLPSPPFMMSIPAN